ncbi:diphthine--ammonia ligase [Vulcanisaeta thermophila]|uniref:diphthine--ammonia ligase n=1 Tax=Vulcanisaeta thermophila TaxID=867917 RepID=UPI000853A3DC|nr:diphthine--ammonia ligase [Vulcanisaeta thermophila]
MRVCALFSGGKDSTYAVHWALLKGFEVMCLITLKPARSDSWMFHYPNVQFTKLQSEALGIPILYQETSGVRDLELNDMRTALMRARELFGIDGVVTGALLSDYQRINMSLVARDVGLRIYSPLWRKDQDKYLVDLYMQGFRFILTSINVMGIPRSMLGRELNLDDIRELIRRAHRYGFNPALEGGEGETYVVDAPLFRGRIVIEDGYVTQDSPYSWTYVIRSARVVPKGEASWASVVP